MEVAEVVTAVVVTEAMMVMGAMETDMMVTVSMQTTTLQKPCSGGEMILCFSVSTPQCFRITAGIQGFPTISI